MGSRGCTGGPQEATVGGRTVTLYPLYHPAAALYTPAMLRTLEEDFAGIPALIGEEPEPAPPAEVIRFPVSITPAVPTPQEQLGLF